MRDPRRGLGAIGAPGLQRAARRPDRPAARHPVPAGQHGTGQHGTGPDGTGQQAPQQPGGAAAKILAAVEAGWCMAELYASIRPDQLKPPPAPDRPLARVVPPREPARVALQKDLPGLGSLRERQELELLIDRVNVRVHELSPLITGAGLTVPGRQDWLSLAWHRRSPEGGYELAREVLQFHGDLFVALTACDHQAGLAYGLGRAVADLSMRPRTGGQKSLADDLRGGRVDAITGWLQELHTALPPHAAGAVSGSIAQWQQWAAQPVWAGAPLDWSAHGRDVVRALADQGKRWRMLLTGQVAALDQLSPQDYVQAAGFFVGRVRQILQRLLLQYWPWITLITVAMVVAVVGSFVLLASPAAKGIGVAISVFGWLGLTGGSISAGLQRAVSHVERSLWEAELDLAAAWANTVLPEADSDRRLGEVRPPAVPLGSVAGWMASVAGRLMSSASRIRPRRRPPRPAP
jgi:hypothetical protein